MSIGFAGDCSDIVSFEKGQADLDREEDIELADPLEEIEDDRREAD